MDPVAPVDHGEMDTSVYEFWVSHFSAQFSAEMNSSETYMRSF